MAAAISLLLRNATPRCFTNPNNPRARRWRVFVRHTSVHTSIVVSSGRGVVVGAQEAMCAPVGNFNTELPLLATGEVAHPADDFSVCQPDVSHHNLGKG